MSDEERERMRGFGYGMLVANAIWCVVLLLTGCASLSSVPSGTPGCVKGHRWSDSAWACIPTDSGKVGR